MKAIRSACVSFAVFSLLLTGDPSFIKASAGIQEVHLAPGESRNTVMVTYVREQSVFERAGLREKDAITEIDFTPVGEMSFTDAFSAVSGASVPGHSIILSVLGREGARMIYVSTPSPDARQETFLMTETEIMEAWEISRAGWEHFIEAACEFALGRKNSRELFRTFRSSRSAFNDSRNSLISVEIPTMLPSGVRSSLSSAKSRLADANTLRYLATRILYRTLVSGGDPIPAEDVLPSTYLSAYLAQGIKSRLVSETGIPGLDSAWTYLRTTYLQTRTPGNESKPLPEMLAEEANMAVREAGDRLERISDLGVLLEEAISYTASTEYEAATLIGGMLLRYPAVEKKANIAAGEGFGHLLKARAGMALR